MNLHCIFFSAGSRPN